MSFLVVAVLGCVALVPKLLGTERAVKHRVLGGVEPARAAPACRGPGTAVPADVHGRPGLGGRARLAGWHIECTARGGSVGRPVVQLRPRSISGGGVCGVGSNQNQVGLPLPPLRPQLPECARLDRRSLALALLRKHPALGPHRVCVARGESPDGTRLGFTFRPANKSLRKRLMTHPVTTQQIEGSRLTSLDSRPALWVL